MIILYILQGCPYCNNAIKLLKENKIKYETITIESEEEKEFYKKQNGMNTFPQIFMQINRNSFIKIGGSTDLEEVVNICKKMYKKNLSIDLVYYMYQEMYK